LLRGHDGARDTHGRVRDHSLEGTHYSTEQALVEQFARCLGSGDTVWGRVNLMFEFDYVGGWADVLALCSDGHLVAFEAKLARWRDALHQAYRTRCFAHRSYVVLPLRTAMLAGRYEAEFRRRRVGLCAVSEQRGIELVFDTDVVMPFQPWIATRARAALSDSETGLRGRMRRCQLT
jgi:hypothetical protein